LKFRYSSLQHLSRVNQFHAVIIIGKPWDTRHETDTAPCGLAKGSIARVGRPPSQVEILKW